MQQAEKVQWMQIWQAASSIFNFQTETEMCTLININIDVARRAVCSMQYALLYPHTACDEGTVTMKNRKDFPVSI